MKRTSVMVGLVVVFACVAGWIVERAVGQGDGRLQNPSPSQPTTYAQPQMFPSVSSAPMPGKKDDAAGANQRFQNHFAPQENNSASTTIIPVQFNADTPATLPARKDPDGRPVFLDSNASNFSAPMGRQEPALSIEWIGPTMIKVGQAATYHLVVKNMGTVPAQGVVVRNRLPGRVSIQATRPKAVIEANSLTWEVGTMQPRQEQRLEMQILPETKGDLSCNAQVTFTTAAMARILVREPKLMLKASGAEKVLMGDVVTLTLTVSNPGDCSADQVKLKATLPEGLEHAKGRKIEFDIGNLAPNESRQVQLVCMARAGGRQVCEVSATAEGNLRSQDLAAVEVILPRIDLTATGPKLRYLDRKAVYSFRVTNPGSAPASNVMISDQLPEGFKFGRASDGGRHDLDTRTVSWFIGDLGPGQTREVNMEAIATAIGEQKHKASVSASRGLRGEIEIATRVEGLSALLMELVDLDDPVEVGTDTAYEIKVTNTGSKTETNLQLVCIIPEKMEFRGAQGPSDCKARVRGKEVVFDPLPRLAPRTDAVYRVSVRGIAPGDLRFRARITADGLSDPVLKEESTKVYGE